MVTCSSEWPITADNSSRLMPPLIALDAKGMIARRLELLSNLVFEFFWSCGDLAWFCGFNSVFEFDASDDFGEGVKAA